MIQYILNYNKIKHTVDLLVINSDGTVLNGLCAQYEDASISESAINERLYIRDKDNSDAELLSLPLVNTVIRTQYV